MTEKKKQILGTILAFLTQTWKCYTLLEAIHCMQIQEKIMDQTCEIDKKSDFRPNFGSFDQNFGPKLFFREFYLY